MLRKTILISYYTSKIRAKAVTYETADCVWLFAEKKFLRTTDCSTKGMMSNYFQFPIFSWSFIKGKDNRNATYKNVALDVGIRFNASLLKSSLEKAPPQSSELSSEEIKIPSTKSPCHFPNNVLVTIAVNLLVQIA